MLEICCGSYLDAINAYRGGAKQIELNSALHLGGLTPSVAALTMIKKETDLKVICMVRPRGAGFCYIEEDYRQMVEEVKVLLENGADGIAFGFLTKDHQIDCKRTKEFITIIKQYHKEVVFHRAFDCVLDPIKAIEQLIELGVDRILTSGLQEKAINGMELLQQLQTNYGTKIQLLAGSGMNKTNIKQLIKTTNIQNIHSSCKDWNQDPTTVGNCVNYCFGPTGHENDYDFVSIELVEQLVAVYNQ